MGALAELRQQIFQCYGAQLVQLDRADLRKDCFERPPVKRDRCGTLLYDGTTCYTLTIRCAAELEKTYHAEFARILAHTRLTDAA